MIRCILLSVMFVSAVLDASCALDATTMQLVPAVFSDGNNVIAKSTSVVGYRRIDGKVIISVQITNELKNTIWVLAERYNVSLEQLAHKNGNRLDIDLFKNMRNDCAVYYEYPPLKLEARLVEVKSRQSKQIDIILRVDEQNSVLGIIKKTWQYLLAREKSFSYSAFSKLKVTTHYFYGSDMSKVIGMNGKTPTTDADSHEINLMWLCGKSVATTDFTMDNPNYRNLTGR
ncbi:MAG: hypothetical protein WC421_11630 [Elusimicrobiales bacterium]